MRILKFVELLVERLVAELQAKALGLFTVPDQLEDVAELLAVPAQLLHSPERLHVILAVLSQLVPFLLPWAEDHVRVRVVDRGARPKGAQERLLQLGPALEPKQVHVSDHFPRGTRWLHAELAREELLGLVLGNRGAQRSGLFKDVNHELQPILVQQGRCSTPGIEPVHILLPEHVVHAVPTAPTSSPESCAAARGLGLLGRSDVRHGRLEPAPVQRLIVPDHVHHRDGNARLLPLQGRWPLHALSQLLRRHALSHPSLVHKRGLRHGPDDGHLFVHVHGTRPRL
mmetsp:Transcript_23452/g.68523  ORF Transcript_23452/g.68523 Transcript_23452/m.68523 type:complete len:285 (+) Transcript_23452:689-1543(+)